MHISHPKIYANQGQAVYNVKVNWHGGNRILWFSVEQRFGDLFTDLSDGPVVALLIPAMAGGESIEVEGKVSGRLHHYLSGAYQRVLRHELPDLRHVAIKAETLCMGRQRAGGVATGFSGGVDSYCVLADYHHGSVPAGMRLTHLLFNNVGSHGLGGERLFRERADKTEKAVKRVGLPFVRVNSNLDTFYGPGLSFQQTHTPRNVSVALLLQHGLGRFYYASAYSYSDVSVGPSEGMGSSDAIVLPLLSTDSLDAISVGGEYTRIEKTLRVAELADSYDTLDVCQRPERAGNCSTCPKCLRTLLTLEIAGLLDRYAPSFDLEPYRKSRDDYIRQVVVGSDPYAREIVRFAKERGFRPLLDVAASREPT